MNIDHLVEDFPTLLQYLNDNHYCDRYIHQIDRTFHFIVKHNNPQWTDYYDVEKAYCISNKMTTNAGRRSALNMISSFDCYGIFPSGKWKNTYFRKQESLNGEFKQFIEHVKDNSSGNGLSDNYNLRCIAFLQQFLLYLQDLGISTFLEVQSKDIIGYFNNKHRPIESYDSSNLLRHALETGFNWGDEIKRIYKDIPIVRRRRKNIQYFSEDEIAALLTVLEDETTKLSFCERSFGYLLYYTGLRACDIAMMNLCDIDWDKELIKLTQHKTDVPLTLPLPVKAGNAIYRYITEERPQCDSERLFIRACAPYRPYNAKSLGANVCKKIYKLANIRQEPGDRKGTHIFRHHFVKTLLENGVSQPVISELVGHADPSSLNSYLNTDFVHLKKCALSIEKYPVSLEVFHNERF